MKKAGLLLVLIVFVLQTFAQKNGIDDLYHKYQGREGITSVYISGKMLSMLGSQDSGDKELGDLMGKLKSIMVITVEDSALNKKINFYEELKKTVDLGDYQEMMSVSEPGGVTKFLFKGTGKKMSELLIISGGKTGNSLISISGDLDLKNLTGLTKNMGIKQLEELNKLEELPPDKK